MTLALSCWAILLAVLGWQTRAYLGAARVAGLAVCVILGLQTAVRPAIFFAGLDTPSPDAWFSGPDWPLIALALLTVSVWMALFGLAYAAAAQIRAPSVLLPRMTAPPDTGAVLTIAATLTALNLACTGALVMKAGGVAEFIVAVKVGKDLAGLYVLREIGTLAVPLLMLAGLLSPRRAWPVAALIALNFAANMLWGNRTNIALLGLAALASVHFFLRPLRLRDLAMLAALAVAGLEGLKALRLLLLTEALGTAAQADLDFWTALSASLHFNQFDALMLALRDAGELFDLTDGREALNGLLAWVPRFLWPEKDVFAVGGWFRRVYEPGVVNGWPVTVVGSWYLNFGWSGLPFGAILSGIVAARIDATYRDLRSNAFAAAIAPATAFLLLDGGTNFGLVQRYVLFVVPLAGIAFLLRTRDAVASPAVRGTP